MAPEQVKKKVLPAGAMDVDELAKTLGVAVRTIWDRIRKGKLPGPGVYLDRRAYWLPAQFGVVQKACNLGNSETGSSGSCVGSP